MRTGLKEDESRMEQDVAGWSRMEQDRAGWIRIEQDEAG